MTLTQAATLTKRGVIIFFLLIILGSLGAFGYQAWYQNYLSTLPPKEEKPEEKFGPLPKINFPPSSVSSSNFSYSLETVTGGLPQTPKVLRIYFIPPASATFLAPEKAKTLAYNLGFPQGPEIISSSRYRFKDSRGELLIDITTGNFHFQKGALEKAATVSAEAKSDFTSENKLIASFKNWLMAKNLLPEELQNGKSNVFYNQNGSGADFQTAIVSLGVEDIDNLPIVTSFLNQGLVKATLTSAEEEKNKFLKIDYIFWKIDKTTSSTYSLKSSEEAFADLRSGLGFVSLEPRKPQVSLSSIYLAYFQSEDYLPYLQPVFVFEGPDFAALVPAVKKSSRENF